MNKFHKWYPDRKTIKLEALDNLFRHYDIFANIRSDPMTTTVAFSRQNDAGNYPTSAHVTTSKFQCCMMLYSVVFFSFSFVLFFFA